jgi:hypothetical protein
MKRSVLNSHGVLELKHTRNRAIKNKIITYSIILFICVLGISIASRIKALNINNVIVSGNKVVDSASIEKVVKNNLNGHYLGILPKTNFIIYPKNKIKIDLQNDFKRIKDITLNNENIKNLEININEYEGKYLYCGNVIPELNSKDTQKCYFMDNNGYIFDEAPYFSGEIYFKFYGLVNSITENPSGNYYNNEIFAKLIEFKTLIEKMDLKPTYIWLNNQDEIYVSLSKNGKMEINPIIILKKDSNLEKMAENLKAAIITEPLKTKLEKNYEDLKYIDLKFGNKVYYKFE